MPNESPAPSTNGGERRETSPVEKINVYQERLKEIAENPLPPMQQQPHKDDDGDGGEN